MRGLLAASVDTSVPSWLLLIMMSWTAYRIGRLVVLDTIWEGWRERLLGWLTTGKKLRVWKLKLSELLTCPFCVTGWTALAVTIAVDIVQRLPLIGLWWFSTWVGALFIWGLIDSDEGPRMEHGKK
jgi:hypothetical protein